MIENFTGNDLLEKEKSAHNIAIKKGFSLKFVDLKNKKSLEEISPYLQSGNMFGEKFLLFLRNADSLSKSSKTTLFNILDKVGEREDTIIILDSEKKLDIKAEKKAFDLPPPWKMDLWFEKIALMAGIHGVKLTKAQTEYILQVTGMDSFRIENEMKKLSVLAEKGLVEDKIFYAAVFEYVGGSIEEFVFNFLKKNFSQALKQFRVLLGEYVFHQIFYQTVKGFLNLYKIKTAVLGMNVNTFDEMKNLSKDLKINIPLLSKFVGFSFNRREKKENILLLYSVSEVDKILEELWEIEFRTKKIGTEPRSEIFTLILKIRGGKL